MENEQTFEVSLGNLETIVRELESGDVELDKAIEKYTEAMKLAKFCTEKIESATKQVNKVLNDDNKLEDMKVN